MEGVEHIKVFQSFATTAAHERERKKKVKTFMVEFFICSKTKLFECKSGKVVNKLECHKIFNMTTEIERTVSANS